MSENYNVEPIVLDTRGMSIGTDDLGVWKNRERFYVAMESKEAPLVSIYVLAYNRLQKTKYCVECILKHTTDFDYELILVDNGSEDGTYAYFQSVPWKNKVLIQVTENLGSAYPWQLVKRIYKGKYLVTVSNDVYVTHNWLSNLLACMESDQRIGFVAPVSSNVSNLQEVSLGFKDMEEMQQKAAAFNRPDPSKWEERMRLISILTIFKKEVIDLVGTADYGFIHDFGEDDYAARLRRAGFKLILCGDTYVHHDHDFRSGEDKDMAQFQKSLESGRQAYKEKYHGQDAWDDVLNFERGLIGTLRPDAFRRGDVHSLCIDVKCGTPVLEIRNHFRRNGSRHKVVSHAFTTEARYYSELQLLSHDTSCDRIEFIHEHYLDGSMDIILLGEPLNTYHRPIALVQKLLGILRKGGILLLKVRNLEDYPSLLQSLKLGAFTDPSFPSVLPLPQFNACLEALGADSAQIFDEPWDFDAATAKKARAMAKQLNPSKSGELYAQLMTRNYLYHIVK